MQEALVSQLSLCVPEGKEAAELSKAILIQGYPEQIPEAFLGPVHVISIFFLFFLSLCPFLHCLSLRKRIMLLSLL